MRGRYDQPDSDDERDWRHATVRRTCRDCLGDVYVGRGEPWTMHLLCEECHERLERQEDDRRRQAGAA